MPTTLLGLAHYLPPDAAVAGVTRPIAAERGGASDLALQPAHDALAQAALDPQAIDLIVFATMTPDVTFPGAACFFQSKLECGTVGALDIRGQCTGFLMGLMIADSFIETAAYRHVLLAAGEVHSAGLDYSPRGAPLAALYGDGAAAAILGAGDGRAGVRSVVCHADGRLHDRFWCEYPASRQHPVRVTVDNLRAGSHFPSLDFGVVEAFGREHLPAAVREALAAAGVTADAIDCFILSHIIPGVARDSAKALGIPATRILDAGARHGHLTAATLPVALSEAIAAQRVTAGSTVCLAACGAGFTWGAAVVTL